MRRTPSRPRAHARPFPRMIRGRRGQEQQIYFLAFEIFLWAMFGLAMALYISDLANDTTYWKEYFSRDISLLVSATSGAPGDVQVSYPYVGSIPVAKPLSFSITKEPENIVQVYDGVGAWGQPATYPYMRNREVDVSDAHADSPLRLGIAKTGYDLTLTFDAQDTTRSCKKPTSMPAAKDVSYLIRDDPPASLPSVTDGVAAQLKVASPLLLAGGISDDRLRNPNADIALLVRANTGFVGPSDPTQETLHVWYSASTYQQGTYLSCSIVQALETNLGSAMVDEDVRAITPDDFADSALADFFNNGRTRVFIDLPPSLSRDPELSKVITSLSFALANAPVS